MSKKCYSAKTPNSNQLEANLLALIDEFKSGQVNFSENILVYFYDRFKKAFNADINQMSAHLMHDYERHSNLTGVLDFFTELQTELNGVNQGNVFLNRLNEGFKHIQQIKNSVNLSSLNSKLNTLFGSKNVFLNKKAKKFYMETILSAIVDNDRLIYGNIGDRINQALTKQAEQLGIIAPQENMSPAGTMSTLHKQTLNSLENRPDLLQHLDEDEAAFRGMLLSFDYFVLDNIESDLKSLYGHLQIQPGTEYAFDLGNEKYSLKKPKGKSYNQFGSEDIDGLDYISPIADLWFENIEIIDTVPRRMTTGAYITFFNKAKANTSPIQIIGNKLVGTEQKKLLSQSEYVHKILAEENLSTLVNKGKLAHSEAVALSFLRKALLDLKTDESNDPDEIKNTRKWNDLFRPNTMSSEVIDSLLKTQDQGIIIQNTDGTTEVATASLIRNNIYRIRDTISQRVNDLIFKDKEVVHNKIKDDLQLLGNISIQVDNDNFYFLLDEQKFDLFDGSKDFAILNPIYSDTRLLNNVEIRQKMSGLFNSSDLEIQTRVIDFLNTYSGYEFTIDGVFKGKVTSDGDRLIKIQNSTMDGDINSPEMLFMELALQNAVHSFWKTHSDSKILNSITTEILAQRNAAKNNGRMYMLVDNVGNLFTNSSYWLLYNVSDLIYSAEDTFIKSVIMLPDQTTTPKSRLNNIGSNRNFINERDLDSVDYTPEARQVFQKNLFYQDIGTQPYDSFYEKTQRVVKLVDSSGESVDIENLSKEDIFRVFNQQLETYLDSINNPVVFGTTEVSNKLLIYPATIADKTTYYQLQIDPKKLSLDSFFRNHQDYVTDNGEIGNLQGLIRETLGSQNRTAIRDFYKYYIFHTLGQSADLANKVKTDILNVFELIADNKLGETLGLTSIEMDLLNQVLKSQNNAWQLLDNNANTFLEIVRKYNIYPKSRLGRSVTDLNNLPHLTFGLHYTKGGINRNLVFKGLAYDSINTILENSRSFKELVDSLNNNIFYNVLYASQGIDFQLGSNDKAKQTNREAIKTMLVDLFSFNYRALTTGHSDQYSESHISDSIWDKNIFTRHSNKNYNLEFKNGMISFQSMLDTTQGKRNVPLSASVIKPVYKGRSGARRKIKVAMLPPLDIKLSNMSGIQGYYEASDGAAFAHPFFARFNNVSYGTNQTDLEHIKAIGELFDYQTGNAALLKFASFPISNNNLRNSALGSDSLMSIFKRMNLINIDSQSMDVLIHEINNLFGDRGFRFLLSDLSPNHIYSQGLENSRVSSNSVVELFNIISRGNNNYELQFEIGGTRHVLATRINNLWDLYNVLGNAYSIDANNRVTEDSLDIMFEAMQRMASKADGDFAGDNTNLYEFSGFELKNYNNNVDDARKQYGKAIDTIKNSFIDYAAYTSAMKTGVSNMNELSNSYQEDLLNFTEYDGNHHGVQGNFDHPTDGSEVISPTQIISLMAQGNHTYPQALKLYQALAELVALQYLNSGYEITGDFNDFTHIIRDKFVEIYKDGAILSGDNMVKIMEYTDGNNNLSRLLKDYIPASHAIVFNNFFSSVISAISREAIKLKTSGNANVLHPSYNVIKYFTIYDPVNKIYQRKSKNALIKEGYTQRQLRENLTNRPDLSLGELTVGETYFIYYDDNSYETKEITSFSDLIAFKNEIANNPSAHVKRHYEENLLPKRIRIETSDDIIVSNYDITQVYDAFNFAEILEKLTTDDTIDNNVFYSEEYKQLAAEYNIFRNKKIAINMSNSIMETIYSKLKSGESVDILMFDEINQTWKSTPLLIENVTFQNPEAVASNPYVSILQAEPTTSLDELKNPQWHEEKFSQRVAVHKDSLKSLVNSVVLVDDINKTNLKYAYLGENFNESQISKRDMSGEFRIKTVNGKKYYVDRGIPIAPLLDSDEVAILRENHGFIVAYKNMSTMLESLYEISNIRGDHTILKHGTLDNGELDVSQFREDLIVLNSDFFGEPGEGPTQNYISQQNAYVARMLDTVNQMIHMFSGRIPAQTMQSVMAMELIDINGNENSSMFVNTMQLYLQGSDLDIDKSYTIYREVANSGKTIHWAPYHIFSDSALIQSVELTVPNLQIAEAIQNLNEGTPLENPLNLTGRNSDEINRKRVLLRELSATFNPKQSSATQFVNSIFRGETNFDPTEVFELVVEIINDITENAKGNIRTGFEQNVQGINFIHNLAIEYHQYLAGNVDLKTSALKNKVNTTMLVVLNDLRNTIATMEPISMDNIKEPIKRDGGGMALLTAVNRQFNPELTAANASGGTNIGRTAVGIKANYAIKNYVGSVKQNQTEGEDYDPNFRGFERIKNKNGEYVTKTLTLTYPYIENGQMIKTPIKVDGFRMFTDETLDKSIIEIYNKLKEAFGGDITYEKLNNATAATKELVDSFYTLVHMKAGDSDSAVKMLSELLSLSTDNAKELGLAKINANPAVSSFYIFGIALGIPYERLYKFMTGPIMKAFNKHLTGSIYQNRNAILNMEYALSSFKSDLESKKSAYLEDIKTELKELGMDSRKVSSYITENLNFLQTIVPAQDSYVWIGKILGINQGIKSKLNEFLSFINTFNSEYNDKVGQEKVVQKNENISSKMDFRRFVLDPDYRERIFDNYDQYSKTPFSPYRIIAANDHYFQMFQVMAKTDDFFNNFIKYRTIKEITERIAKDHKNRKIYQNEYPKLASAVDTSLIALFIDSLSDYNITLKIPAGTTFQRYKNPQHVANSLVESEREIIDNYYETVDSTSSIQITSHKDMANFKKWVEDIFVPYIKNYYRNEKGISNTFIDSLETTTYRNNEVFGNRRKTLSLGIDMSNVDINTNIHFQNLVSAFSQIHEDLILPQIMTFEKSNFNLTVGDIFRLYNLVVYKERTGNHSFQKLFEQVDRFSDKHAVFISDRYTQFISDLDKELGEYVHELKLVSDVQAFTSDNIPTIKNILSRSGIDVNGKSTEDIIQSFFNMLYEFYDNSVFNVTYESQVNKSLKLPLPIIKPRSFEGMVQYLTFENQPFRVFIEHAVLPVNLAVNRVRTPIIGKTNLEETQQRPDMYSKYIGATASDIDRIVDYIHSTGLKMESVGQLGTEIMYDIKNDKYAETYSKEENEQMQIVNEYININDYDISSGKVTKAIHSLRAIDSGNYRNLLLLMHSSGTLHQIPDLVVKNSKEHFLDLFNAIQPPKPTFVLGQTDLNWDFISNIISSMSDANTMASNFYLEPQHLLDMENSKTNSLFVEINGNKKINVLEAARIAQINPFIKLNNLFKALVTAVNDPEVDIEALNAGNIDALVTKYTGNNYQWIYQLVANNITGFKTIEQQDAKNPRQKREFVTFNKLGKAYQIEMTSTDSQKLNAYNAKIFHINIGNQEFKMSLADLKAQSANENAEILYQLANEELSRITSNRDLSNLRSLTSLIINLTKNININENADLFIELKSNC